MRLDHRDHLHGWLRLVLFLSLSFAVMALAFAAADAHAQTFSKPMKLSNTSGSSAPQVVVDSNGHIEVVWEDRACGIWISGSTDSGTTFSAPASVAKASSCSQDERMAVDPQGNINVVWSSPSTIYFARSTDGGSTFSTPTNISQSIPAANYPAMALASDGSINVEWMGGSPRSLFLSRSENGGGSFSTTTIWSLPAQPETVASEVRIATRADGSIDVVWSSDTGAPYCDIFFSRSTDKGAHFASPTNLSHSTRCATFPQMAIDASGNIDVVWYQGAAGLFFSQSTDGGANFSSPTSIPQAGAEQMAVDASGSINIAFWHDPDMMFSRSVNGGANFSTPKDLGPGGGQHIAVDSEGNIDILWQGTYANGHDDIFFTRSTDGGSNFSTPVNVSINSGQAELSEMAVEANGDIDIVWDDNGGGSSLQDTSVYFRRAAVSGDFTISAAPASLVVLPGGSATAQITVKAVAGFNQAVNLSCTKLPPGASCSFDSASVTPSHSGAHANVTLTVPTTMAQGSFTMTLSGASGSTTRTQDMQVAMGGMTGSVTPTAAVIPAGSTANFTVSINSSGGFSGQVNLACGGAPSGVSCIFNPAQLTVSPNGSVSVSSTLTVQVVTKPAGSLTHRNPRSILPIMQESLPISCFVLLLCTLALALSSGARTFLREAYCRRAAMARALGAIALTIALAAAMVSCGGATNTRSATVGGSTSVTFPLAIQTRSGSAIVNLGTISVTVP